MLLSSYLNMSYGLFQYLTESTHLTNKEISGQLKSLNHNSPIAFRTLTSSFPHTSRRPLGSVHAFTGR